MPVSCFHFSVSLLHAWLFWKMTSLLCWKFTLVYRVQIHYAMATILVACVLQSLQNNTIEHKYQWLSEIDTSQNIWDWQLSDLQKEPLTEYILSWWGLFCQKSQLCIVNTELQYRVPIQSYNTGSTFTQHKDEIILRQNRSRRTISFGLGWSLLLFISFKESKSRL